VSIAVYHNLLLLSICTLHGYNSEPGALVVLYIGAYFSGYLWIAKTIKKVVLHLEKVTHFEQYCLGLSKCLGIFVAANKLNSKM